jgi:hypothetical protein
MNPLPIPWKTDDFLPAHGLQGPTFLMEQYGKKVVGISGALA